MRLCRIHEGLPPSHSRPAEQRLDPVCERLWRRGDLSSQRQGDRPEGRALLCGRCGLPARGRLRDERQGIEHDYSRKGGVVHAEILAPENAPDWMRDRDRLWNAVEAVERRKDAQLAREIEVALPRELDRGRGWSCCVALCNGSSSIAG